jgi:D-alanine-D-alanine ligase-like ATP-grasp enzyme
VWSDAELREAAERIFVASRVMLVQRAYGGVDHRIIVLDGRVLRAFERRPLSVTGDGASTVTGLLEALQRSFEADGRDTELALDDPRIDASLARASLDRSTVLGEGRVLPLLDVANLSTGGVAVDVTREIHPTFADLAIRVARDFDLRFAGVDILAEDVRVPADDYTILEINSAPGLDYYTGVGPTHEAAVDAAYAEVLRAVGYGP